MVVVVVVVTHRKSVGEASKLDLPFCFTDTMPTSHKLAWSNVGRKISSANLL